MQPPGAVGGGRGGREAYQGSLGVSLQSCCESVERQETNNNVVGWAGLGLVRG